MPNPQECPHHCNTTLPSASTLYVHMSCASYTPFNALLSPTYCCVPAPTQVDMPWSTTCYIFQNKVGSTQTFSTPSIFHQTKSPGSALALQQNINPLIPFLLCPFHIPHTWMRGGVWGTGRCGERRDWGWDIIYERRVKMKWNES